ncbi:hypothetical protein [Luteolibacter sp. Populi]|uniref:hypothetical protein n=1 Tax=Luteolibacter sp. Populi TaxID=3230487 RepID=UPI0034668D4E
MDLPPHLHSTRNLLMRSLPAHGQEQAPPMPAGLADDLLARFAPKSVVIARPVSLFGKARTFLATPGFGLAATAVVLLGIGVPMLSGPSRQETFRGANLAGAASEGPGICFVGRNAALQSAIEKSGSFEISAFRSASNRETALALSGSKVVVDFTTDTITAYDAEGNEVHSAKIPDQEVRVAGAVADAVSRL